MAENEKKKNKFVPILITVLALIIVAAGVIILLLVKKQGESGNSLNYTSEHGIGYEMNAVVLTSGDMAFSQPEGVAIKFSTAAFSSDGYNFSCKIVNSTANTLDMYVDIYWDASFEEELYLSGLMRPGEGITSFKTNREIPKGSYEVVLVPTLMEDDHKTIHSQSSVYLTLVVE